MRPVFALAVLAVVLMPGSRAAAQVSAYTWTFKGNPGGSGQVLADSLHVVGADDGSTATGGYVSWLEAFTPVPLHVTCTCHYINNDDGENDAPVSLIDGVFTKPDTGGFWGTGTYDFSFDVPPGHTFGFGIWTSDAILGAGIGDFVDFEATTLTWGFLSGGVDPQPWFTTQGEPSLADALCGIGDVDGDGVSELVVASHSATVTVYSGATGAPLYTLDGLGSVLNSVDGAGDVNADGVPDFVLGLPGALINKGLVEAHSGADGALLFAASLSGSGLQAFGSGVGGLGDTNGDGYADVAGGAPFAQMDRGEVRVLGGPDGHLLHDLFGPSAGAHIGRHLASLDDVDLDGVRDLAYTLEGILATQVVVLSGHTVAPLSVSTESQAASGTNSSFIASAHDFDGDGRGDIAWWLNPQTLTGGKVTIHSGATGLEIWSWKQPHANDETWSTVTSGDVNADGLTDIAFSASVVEGFDLHKVVKVYSGAAMHPQLEQYDPVGFPGAVVTAFGDVDLDGATDLAISPWSDGVQTQVLHALDGNGAPNLHGVGTLVPGTPVTLVVKKAKPSAPLTLVIGLSYLAAPFKGGTLVPQPQLLVPAVADSFGRASFGATWPAGLVGPLNFWSQAWIVDADGPYGLTATNGLSGSMP